MSAQPSPTPATSASGYPWLPYVLPFAAFMLLLGLAEPLSAALGRWEAPVRAILLICTLWYSRHVIDLRVQHALATIAMGVAIFAIWIAPDLLIPGYRDHWLFQNSVTGRLSSSVAPIYRDDLLVLATRALRAIILVPIIEELFWRAFLMRWLVNRNFLSVPLGSYTHEAMWITALLFASEHGPYWEVGLVAGLAYNWWMVRTKSLGDCILAHAVTNGVLSAYVLITGNWQYWM